MKDGLLPGGRYESIDDEAFETGRWKVVCINQFIQVNSLLTSTFFFFFAEHDLESDIYEDPSVRFESKKILQPDPTNMENYLVKL